MLQTLSFRQLLVIAFLLIAVLLGAASLRGLRALEDLTRESRDSAAHAADRRRRGGDQYQGGHLGLYHLRCLR